MTTSHSTGGDLARNAVWRDLLGPAGGGDCLQAFLGVDGTCWAFLDLSRERSRGWFDERDIAFIGEVAPTLATRARGELRTPNCRGDELDEPGTIVLDRNLSLVAATEAAWSWIDRLRLERPSELEPLPGSMYALATRALSSTVSPLASARVRLPTADRRHWVVVRASPITQGQAIAGGLVLSIETARSDDLAPLLMRAWSLSPRERDVAKLVIDGLSSDEIAASLYISPHTAKDHIRAIFDKTGVHRRRDLIAALAGQGAAD